MTLPVIVLNTFCLGSVIENESKTDKESSEHMLILLMLGALVTLVIYSAVVLAGEFFRFSATKGILLTLLLQFAFTLSFTYIYKSFPKEKK